LGIGDWGLGIGPNPQSPIPNPHFTKKKCKINILHIFKNKIKFKKYLFILAGI